MYITDSYLFECKLKHDSKQFKELNPQEVRNLMKNSLKGFKKQPRTYKLKRK